MRHWKKLLVSAAVVAVVEIVSELASQELSWEGLGAGALLFVLMWGIGIAKHKVEETQVERHKASEAKFAALQRIQRTVPTKLEENERSELVEAFQTHLRTVFAKQGSFTVRLKTVYALWDSSEYVFAVRGSVLVACGVSLIFSNPPRGENAAAPSVGTDVIVKMRRLSILRTVCKVVLATLVVGLVAADVLSDGPSSSQGLGLILGLTFLLIVSGVFGSIVWWITARAADKHFPRLLLQGAKQELDNWLGDRLGSVA